MNVLVLNCGSSSLKFQVIDTDLDKIAQDADRLLASGMVERIGGQSLMRLHPADAPSLQNVLPLRDHQVAIDEALRWLVSPQGSGHLRALSDIDAVGHRVVHGGEKFIKSVVIDAEVLAGIEECVELAPLHNPANLKGIRAARNLLGEGVPQVAVFDTAFHATLAETAYLYGLPYSLYRRHKIRRYGFHGTSHRYVAYRYRKLRGLEKDQTNVISLHLGNGCSACAIQAGKSVETSMGFTPLEGLLMGTRCGDLDPSIVEFLVHKEGLSVNEVDTLLNKQSGLLGLSGLTGDMRDLLAEEAENGDRRARLAIDVFCARIRKYVGAYFVAMGGADALIFTGGIGENSPAVRQRVCAGLECLGLRLDAEKNLAASGGSTTAAPTSTALPSQHAISQDNSTLAAYVIPTNEELLIARDTIRCLTPTRTP